MSWSDATTLAVGRQRTVLTLLCEGVRRVYSDAVLTFSDISGEVVTRAGMQEPDLSDQLGQSGDALALEILDPADWRDIVAGLDGAQAELCQIVEGQAWADRRVILRGLVDSPDYGAPEEPIRFSLQSAPWTDRGLIPLPTWQVSASTWPRTGSALVCPEGQYGPFYPVILGNPGARLTAAEADWYPIPALIVEMDDTNDPPDNSAAACTILLGAERLGCAGDSIDLFNATTGQILTTDPTTVTRDASGQLVTVVSVEAVDLPITAGDELWWRPLPGEPAGIPGTDTAGTAIRWLMGYSSAEVDTAMLQDAAERLTRWRVDFVINEPIPPYSFIQDHLLSILPVEVVESPGGVGLVVMPTDPPDSAAVETIDVDAAGGYRDGPVQCASWRDLSTSLSLTYGADVRLGSSRRRIDLDATLTAPVGTRQPAPYGAVAAVRFPGVRLLEIDTAVVCDDGTAGALAEYHLRRASQIVREVSVALPQRYQYLQSGDIVALTVADIEWSGVLCIVLSVPRIAGMGVFRLRTMPDWSRT